MHGGIPIAAFDALRSALLAGSWRPSIGDPTLIGWLIFLSYLLAAVACAWALRVAFIGSRIAGEYTGPERRAAQRRAAYRASFLFWILLAAIMVLLGINKQLDLQVLITEVGRSIAAEQGWFAQRRLVQGAVAAAVILGGLGILTALLRMTRHLLPRHITAFVGTVLLACFLLGRSLSYHHLDVVFWQEFAGIKVRHVIEISGICCVGLCAVMNCRWCRLAHILGRERWEAASAP